MFIISYVLVYIWLHHCIVVIAKRQVTIQTLFIIVIPFGCIFVICSKHGHVYLMLMSPWWLQLVAGTAGRSSIRAAAVEAKSLRQCCLPGGDSWKLTENEEFSGYSWLYGEVFVWDIPGVFQDFDHTYHMLRWLYNMSSNDMNLSGHTLCCLLVPWFGFKEILLQDSNQLMVNWWFGARWFGFRKDPRISRDSWFESSIQTINLPYIYIYICLI